MKIVNYFKKKMKKRFQLSGMRKIIFVHDRTSQNSRECYFQLINELKEDYDIKVCCENEFDSLDISNVDMVVIWTSWNSSLERKFRVWYRCPVGIYVSTDNEKPPRFFKYHFRSIWTDSFASLKKYGRHPNVRFGFCLEGAGKHNKTTSGWNHHLLACQFRKCVESICRDNVLITNPVLEKENIVVGRHSYHNGNLRILGGGDVSIGSFNAFGANVTIVTENHDYNFTAIQGFVYRYFFSEKHPGASVDSPSRVRTKGPIVIGSDIWLADNVTVLSGVTIGDGAVIATGSIVTKDIGDYEIWGGVPAKKIGDRFSHEAKQSLIAKKWWTWSNSRIKREAQFFQINWNLKDQL